MPLFHCKQPKKVFLERDKRKATNHVLLQLVHDVHYGRRGRKREEGREITTQTTK